MERLGRFVLAIAAFLFVVLLLGIGATPIDAIGIEAERVAFWTSLEAAVRYFFAAGIGAIVARRSFVAPVISLAAMVWVVTAYILYSIGQPAGVGLAEVAVGQLPGLALLIVAVTCGAWLGRWFYKCEIEAVAAAV